MNRIFTFLNLFVFTAIFSYQSNAQCSSSSDYNYEYYANYTEVACVSTDTTSYYVSGFSLGSKFNLTKPFTLVSANDSKGLNPGINSKITIVGDTIFFDSILVNTSTYNVINLQIKFRDSCNNEKNIIIYSNEIPSSQINSFQFANYNQCDSIFYVTTPRKDMTNMAVLGYTEITHDYTDTVPATISLTENNLSIAGLDIYNGYMFAYTNACGQVFREYFNAIPNFYSTTYSSGTPKYVCDSIAMQGVYVVNKVPAPYTYTGYTVNPSATFTNDTPKVTISGDTIFYNSLVPGLQYIFSFTDSCGITFSNYVSIPRPDSPIVEMKYIESFCDSTSSISIKFPGDNSRYYNASIVSNSLGGTIFPLTTVSNSDSLIISGIKFQSNNQSYILRILDTICHNDVYIPLTTGDLRLSTGEYVPLYQDEVVECGVGIEMYVNIIGVPPFELNWIAGPNVPDHTFEGNKLILSNLVQYVNIYTSDYYQFSIEDACGNVDTFEISTWQVNPNNMFYPTIVSANGGCAGGTADNANTVITINQSQVASAVINGPGSPAVSFSNDTIRVTNMIPNSTYHVLIEDTCGKLVDYLFTSSSENVPMTITPSQRVFQVCDSSIDSSFVMDILVSNPNFPFNVELSGPIGDTLLNMTALSFSFDSLVVGTYLIKITDSCNNIQSLTYTITDPGSVTANTAAYFTKFKGCDSVVYTGYMYPFDAVYDFIHTGPVKGYVVRGPDTFYAPEVYDTFTNGPTYTFTFPSKDTMFGWDYMYITDGCVHTHYNPVYSSSYINNYYVCESGELYTKYIFQYYNYYDYQYPLKIVQYSGTTSIDSFVLNSAEDSMVIDVHTGEIYCYRLYDNCGRLLHNECVGAPYNMQHYYETRLCLPATDGDHKGNVNISTYNVPSGSLSIHQISGPSVIPDSTIYNKTTFQFTNIDTGTYSLQFIDECGRSDTFTFRVEPYRDSVVSTFIPGCLNANKAVVNYYSNKYSSNYNTLQLDGDGLRYNSSSMSGNIINGDTIYNIPSNSSFQIYNYWGCLNETFTTPTYNNPTISASAGFSCADGFSIAIMGAEGVEPFSYGILSGSPTPYSAPLQSSNVFSGLPSVTGNSYQVRINDQCGNAFTAFVSADSINNPLQTVGIACIGSNYTASVDSIPNIIYEWITPDSTIIPSRTITFSPITDADSGIYYLRLTNTITGCESVIAHNVSLTQCDLQAITNHTDLKCSYSTNGTIDILTFGGYPPYTFLWSDGATTEDRYNLPQGSYSVLITDDQANQITVNVDILAPAPIAINTVPTNVSCYGLNDGSISTVVTGGVEEFSYSWSNGENTANLSNLTAGTYKLFVTDTNACIDSVEVIITQPDSMDITNIVTNVVCNGNADGSIDITVNGGTPTYTYLWSNGATTEDLSGLEAGIYSVTVTDSKGCTKLSQDFVVTEPDSFVIDSVVYNTVTGDVSVMIDSPSTGLVYSVVSITPSTIPLPPSNSTGEFNLTGATEAVFQVSDGICSSILDTVNFGEPLPVRFLSVEVFLYENDKARIIWEAIEYPGVNRYEIEKSKDGSFFEVIHTRSIDPITAERKMKYELIDPNLHYGNNYYRIKEIDESDKFIYSDIKLVKYTNAHTTLIYPNPTNGKLSIEFVAETTLDGTFWINDNNGKRVFEQKATPTIGKNLIHINVSHLADGNYYFNYKIDNDKIGVIKFSKFSK